MYVIGLMHEDGKIEPLVWTKDKLSKKELRRVTKRFKKDQTVTPCITNWFRLYKTKEEMLKELNEY